MRCTVSALHVYPVKSCRGISPGRVTLTPHGVALDGVRDREWMIVDTHGRFVTHRELPRMATIDVRATDAGIALCVPGSDPVVPVASEAAVDVTVWHASVRGRDGGDAVASALSDYLGRKLRLVRFDDTKPRLVNPDYAGTTGATTLYADGYPVLVTGEASLDELNTRLDSRGIPGVPMDRFRPNVVVDGLDAFDEDHVDTLAIGDVVLKLVKPCTRCEITTTDQRTGRRSDEPLRTLASYRHDDRLAGIRFGMNAIVLRGEGSSIGVGDAVEATFRF